ncbi:hypothetical protein H5410_035025 [Solanum commersonii]|uniref:Serine-threonine/tyrosine-protein kinase catalytic domain-containing protein n=1 Tax=Solanum commersonii TaxID=4109 RepID=A0A9J5Y031_SOLCO|nr:hypothetical protein H5410_035025 [Solanum commersonii]
MCNNIGLSKWLFTLYVTIHGRQYTNRMLKWGMQGNAATISRMTLAVTVYELWMEGNHRVSKYMSLREYYCERTVKFDVYFCGILMLELMAKRTCSFLNGFVNVKTLIANAANRGKKYLVHECFKKVDHPIAFDLTRLVILCTDFGPDKRPTMKDVIDALNAMGMRGQKRKRNKNEAETEQVLAVMLLLRFV